MKRDLRADARAVKGIHVAWANDPPNPKIKDWNVTDLRVRRTLPSGSLRC